MKVGWGGEENVFFKGRKGVFRREQLVAVWGCRRGRAVSAEKRELTPALARAAAPRAEQLAELGGILESCVVDFS